MGCVQASSTMNDKRHAKRARTRSKQQVAAQQEPLQSAAFLDLLPDAVLLYGVLSSLESSDLCSMMAVSRRMQALQQANDEQLWGPIVSERWESSHLQEAVALAGGHRAFALAKHSASPSANSHDHWHRPCEFELRASIARIVACISGSPSSRVLFLLDGSGSVGDEEFGASTSFIAHAASALKATSADHECKVTVMQFSNDVRTEWEDTQETGAAAVDAFQSTIKSMVRMNGGTNIAAALTQAGKMLKNTTAAAVAASENGGGSDGSAAAATAESTAKVIVLITDGRVDGYQAKEARHVAAMMADEQPNTTMFAFGVGRGVDRAELLSIIQPAYPPACKYPHPSARYLDLFFKDDAPW